MTQSLNIAPDLQRKIDLRANELKIDYQFAQWKQTDRMFAVLLLIQWLACIAVATWLSPLAREGHESHIHPHIWARCISSAD